MIPAKPGMTEEQKEAVNEAVKQGFSEIYAGSQQGSGICQRCKGTGRIETTTEHNKEWKTYQPCPDCSKRD